MNNYELLEEIGRGAFATVFKAVDKRIHNIVAIKIVEKKNFSFFDKEINILSSLNSPYIVKYIEHFTSEEKLYIITEFIEGNDLLTHLNTKGCLNEIQAKKIFAKIVAGIYYLHSIKVMHRDLKMENIMITPDDDVKIIDFGLSVQTNKILFNTLCGSLAYCAPERLVGKPYSYSADIWALGVVLFGMLTRKLPFWNENSQKLSKMIVKDKVEFPYFLSLPAIDVMTKMLTKESEERISINALIQHPFVVEEYQFLQNNMDLSESASSTIFPKLGLSPNMMNLRCFKSTYSVTNQNVNGNYRRRISVNSLLKRPQIALFHTPNMSSRNEIKK